MNFMVLFYHIGIIMSTFTKFKKIAKKAKKNSLFLYVLTIDFLLTQEYNI